MRISDWSSDVCSSDLVAEHVPQRQAVAEREVELPALLADVGDAKTLHRHAAQGEVPAGREGEVLRIEPGGIVGQLLQALAGVRPPDADAAIVDRKTVV